ncbi:MAG TPA: ABC transporter permease, partial [Gemmatimonadaceae bacterium]|nr:ABC transporter permease [Gemmatimonadaceae bacterium]
MTLAPGWRRLFRVPRFTRRAIERDVDDELAFHIAMRAEKLRDAGTPAERAETEALARFGNAARVRGELLTIDRQFVREARFMDWLDSLRGDLRYAIRTLRRAPVFTVVAVLTLAIGIGATSAMFSLVNGILLEPLPYPHAEQLVSVRQSYPEKGLNDWPLSQENVAMYRDGASDFASFAAVAMRSVTLGGEHPERLSILRTTGEFFDVLGVPPLLGHPYGNADDAPGKNNVAVLGYGFWESHFGGRRDAIGKVIELDGTPTTIVGVMPRGFSFPQSGVQLYLPLGLDPTRRFGWFLTGVARLRPGASVEQAHQQTKAIFLRWAA